MQINRLFEIIYILLDKKTVTANELAKKFEVSSRTIYRDIEIRRVPEYRFTPTRAKVAEYLFLIILYWTSRLYQRKNKVR